MKGAGFTHLGTKEGMAALQGDFAGYRSCTVAVFTVQPLNVVSMIGVVFRPRDNWADLESDYNFFKDMLTENEEAIVRRGRNSSHLNVPKSASAIEYKSATGFEALFGYLYLKGENERINELFSHAYEDLQ
jgi:hypothetical protein